MKSDLSIFSDSFLFERLNYIINRFKDLHISRAEIITLSQDKTLITEELIKRGYIILLLKSGEN